MTKSQIFALLFALLILGGLNACKPTSKKGAWIPEDKQMFLKYCKEARQSKDVQLSSRQINAICDCALRQSIKVYESFRAANADTIKLVGEKCIEQM